MQKLWPIHAQDSMEMIPLGRRLNSRLHGGWRSESRRRWYWKKKEYRSKRSCLNGRSWARLPVFSNGKEGKSVREISEEIGISERLVRSYLWRAGNPEKYKALLAKCFAKKKRKCARQAHTHALKCGSSKQRRPEVSYRIPETQRA